MTEQGDAAGDAYRRRHSGRVAAATLALAVVMVISACGGAASPSGSGITPESSDPPDDPIATDGASPTPGVIIGGAGGDGGGDPNMAAFSDSRPFSASTWTMLAPILKSQGCVATPTSVETMSRDDALNRARAFLADAVGEDAMRAFEASDEASSAGKAKTAAVGAAITGNDAGALAAMLSTIGHDPDDPRHLVNAAALMPAFGLGSEALALLDAAETMEPPDSTPYGLDQGAVALAVRGHALLSLGQWADAASALQQAYETDGALLEAAENLSLALLCQGADDHGNGRRPLQPASGEAAYDGAGRPRHAEARGRLRDEPGRGRRPAAALDPDPVIAGRGRVHPRSNPADQAGVR